MSKSRKTESTAEAKSTEMMPTTTDALTWSDWFDHWPELFARRWPDTFRNLPFWNEVFRIEQFTEDDGTLVVRAELPGVDPDQDVHVAIDDGRMTISGERHTHTESGANESYRSEFQYGAFSRSLRLPVGAMVDEIRATYRDGILEVRVPVDADRPGVTQVPITTD